MFEVDLDDVRQNIDEAQVVSLYFPLLGKTMLVDTRTDGHSGPMVRLVEMARSVSDRYRSLRRLRPEFPRPRSITMIPWGRRVSSLDGTGVWASLLQRLDRCGDRRCVESAEACLAELRLLERQEVRRVLTGHYYRTLWGRPGAGDRDGSAPLEAEAP